jgi:hypothetical protein
MPIKFNWNLVRVSDVPQLLTSTQQIDAKDALRDTLNMWTAFSGGYKEDEVEVKMITEKLYAIKFRGENFELRYVGD